MDKCASILVSFPPDDELDDEQYHKAAKQHVQTLDKLTKDRTLSPFAAQLLEVWNLFPVPQQPNLLAQVLMES